MGEVELRRSSRDPAGVTLAELDIADRHALAAALHGDAGVALDDLVAAVETIAVRWMAAVIYDEDLIACLNPVLRELQAVADSYLALPLNQRALLHDVLRGFGYRVDGVRAETAARDLSKGFKSLVELPSRGRRVAPADFGKEHIDTVAVNPKVAGRATAVAATAFFQACQSYFRKEDLTTNEARETLSKLMAHITIETGFSAFDIDGRETPLLMRVGYEQDGSPSSLRVFSRVLSMGIPAARRRIKDDR